MATLRGVEGKDAGESISGDFPAFPKEGREFEFVPADGTDVIVIPEVRSVTHKKDRIIFRAITPGGLAPEDVYALEDIGQMPERG